MKVVITQKVCGPHHLKGDSHPPEGEPITLVGDFAIDVCNAAREATLKAVRNMRAMADIPDDYEGEEETEEKPKPAAKARKASGTTPKDVREEIENGA